MSMGDDYQRLVEAGHEMKGISEDGVMFYGPKDQERAYIFDLSKQPQLFRNSVILPLISFAENSTQHWHGSLFLPWGEAVHLIEVLQNMVDGAVRNECKMDATFESEINLHILDDRDGD